jgi:hypothetical protein
VPGQPSATNLVARWDGTTWHAMGGSLNGDVYASARLPNGDIVVGGAFTAIGGVATGTVARWNGTSWVALGTGTTGLVRALAVLPNGHLVAGGTVISAGGQTVVGLARWDGTVWSPLGTGVPNVRALAALPDGTLMAASAASMFTTSPNQTKLWNGSYWWNLGAPADAEIDVLLPLHDGAVIAAGRFTSIGGVVAPHLARWNGAAWSAIAGGTSGPIHAVAAKPSGELAIGGNFATANGAVATHFVRVVNPCPPGAVVSGAGCPSSGGANVLEVLSPAYLGSTFRARGTGLPSLALVSVITGFTPISVPLAALLPQGVAGCNLLVSPDHLYFAVAEAGTVTTAIPLPSSMALVGLSFFHQLNPVEVDASLNIVAVTASNALQLTTGWF